MPIFRAPAPLLMILAIMLVLIIRPILGEDNFYTYSPMVLFGFVQGLISAHEYKTLDLRNFIGLIERLIYLIILPVAELYLMFFAPFPVNVAAAFVIVGLGFGICTDALDLDFARIRKR